jgi:helix-turn-helix protein
LGVDRLEVLCSLTKDSEEKDPVSALLEKYAIPFDQTSEVNMTEFKNKVDAAISNERLLKKGLQIDFDLVANAINAKVGIDKALIKKLKDIQDCEGKPETHLRTLTLSQGSDDPETEAKKRFQDFNSLSSRLVKTIDYIINNRDHLDSLDKDIFVYLYGKIEELRQASNIVIEEKPEA